MLFKYLPCTLLISYYTTTISFSTYTYTGQYSYTADFGLMFYNGRWYDSSLGRFAQADTTVPGGIQGYDRYAYGLNNPVKYVDPSGHDPWQCGNNMGCYSDWLDQYQFSYDPDFGLSNRYNITTRDLSAQEKFKNLKAAKDIGKSFSEVIGGSSSGAFRAAYAEGLVIQKSNQKCEDCWGKTDADGFGGSIITIYSNADITSDNYNDFLVHEMGHAFDNAMNLQLSSGYSERIRRMEREGWTAMPTGNAGFASSGFPSAWIQGDHTAGYIEEVADMFLGWTYDSWGKDLRRGNWMALWMGPLLTTHSGPSDDAQYHCNEDTGEGCQ